MTADPACICPPCPGRGNDGHGLTHCAECCFGTGVEVDLDCSVHGQPRVTADHTPERLSTEESEQVYAIVDAVLAGQRTSNYREVVRLLHEHDAAHLADVEARLAAAEAVHRVIHQAGAELVCFCGAHLSVYGLTRSLASVFAQHVRDARALHPDPSEVARDE